MRRRNRSKTPLEKYYEWRNELADILANESDFRDDPVKLANHLVSLGFAEKFTVHYINRRFDDFRLKRSEITETCPMEGQLSMIDTYAADTGAPAFEVISLRAKIDPPERAPRRL